MIHTEREREIARHRELRTKYTIYCTVVPAIQVHSKKGVDESPMLKSPSLLTAKWSKAQYLCNTSILDLNGIFWKSTLTVANC